ncbi:MAG TPA: VOC family protein [Armatimonadota bacterium]|jgi:hypothetical protein
MPRVVHFELPADDPERAIAFYTRLFGWTFDKWGDEDYWLIGTGAEGEPGIDGGMGRRSPHNDFVVNTVDVADLDASVQAVIACGGSIVMPKTPIPTVGWLAYCTDTEGNRFGMLQSDEKAG